jgi:hypothetical protein
MCLFLTAACKSSTDFTGFWKGNCTDAFGVQIKKQTGNLYSVSFCGPGGCFAPGEWTPNTTIIGDTKYRVVDPTTIEIGNGQNWTRYIKCTTDLNPVLDYATMISKSETEAFAKAQREKIQNENLSGQTQQDPHRPRCASASCKKIQAFVKKNYCGDSPFGEGSDDSCDLREAKKPTGDFKVIADYKCEWNETKNESECKRNGEMSAELRSILVKQLEKAGMPVNAKSDEIYFTVWQPKQANWLAAEAYYSRNIGSVLQLCEIVAIVDQSNRVTILRKLPWKETNNEVPEATTWSLIDIADTRGGGKLDIILEGDAYEDHWFEVISFQDGTAKTIFSGLGYYL